MSGRPITANEKGLIDLKNAEAEFGLTRDVIRRMIMQKVIASTRVRGNTIMIRASELRAFLESSSERLVTR
jgi:excisionase family DNA binding protein